MTIFRSIWDDTGYSLWNVIYVWGLLKNYLTYIYIDNPLSKKKGANDYEKDYEHQAAWYVF